MKLDKERGAEDIYNFGMTMQFFGSILQCMIATSLMYNYQEHETAPNRFFICCAIVGLSILIAAFMYPRFCEERASEDEHQDHGQHHDHSFGEKI
jgi:hypothetical protein